MPDALARACWCGRTQPCSEHRHERNRRQGSAHSRGYGRRWETFRAWVIRLLCRPGTYRAGLCGARLEGAPVTADSQCAAAGLIVVGTELDHIVPHRGNEQRMYDRLNVQLLCAPCHGVKSQGERG